MPNPFADLVKSNRLPLILVAGGGVFVASQLLNRSPAAVVSSGDAIAANELAGLLLQAQGAGAEAAIAGFNPGAAVAIAGLGVGQNLGIAALDSATQIASVLANSQANLAIAGLGVISDLGLGILGAIGEGTLGGGGGTKPGGGSGGGSGGSGGPGGGSGGGGVGPPVYIPPAGGGNTGPGAGGGTGPVENPPITPPTGSGASSYTAVFSRATTVYARHSTGYIGEHATFGQAGLRIRVNPIVIPQDPVHLTGGSFWRMIEGAKTGWLISQHDPNVTVAPMSANAQLSGFAPTNGAQAQMLGLAPSPGYTTGYTASQAGIIGALQGSGVMTRSAGNTVDFLRSQGYSDSAIANSGVLGPPTSSLAAVGQALPGGASVNPIPDSSYSNYSDVTQGQGGMFYSAYRDGVLVARIPVTGTTDIVALNRQYGVGNQ